MNKKGDRTEGRWGSGILITLFIGLVFFSIMPVNAQNMSITTFDLLTRQDIQIYIANNTLYGTWNTSSPRIELPASDFQMVIRPTGLARFSDPETMLEDGFTFVENNWAALLVIGAVFGLASGRVL